MRRRRMGASGPARRAGIEGAIASGMLSLFGMLGVLGMPVAIGGIGGIGAFGAMTSARAQGATPPADSAQAAPRFKLTPVCPGVAGAEANREFGIVGFEVDRQAGMVWMWWQAFDARGMPRDSGRDALAACTVVDAMNWRCGGQTRTFSRLTSVGEAHAMEDGHYRYTPTHPPSADAARRCRVRVSPH